VCDRAPCLPAGNVPKSAAKLLQKLLVYTAHTTQPQGLDDDFSIQISVHAHTDTPYTTLYIHTRSHKDQF